MTPTLIYFYLNRRSRSSETRVSFHKILFSIPKLNICSIASSITTKKSFFNA